MAASRRDLPILRVLAALLLALGGLVAGNMGAGAEALPVRVILSHVPVMTTWGPPDANGVVMLVLEEGDIRADLVGLPPLGLLGDPFGLGPLHAAMLFDVFQILGPSVALCYGPGGPTLQHLVQLGGLEVNFAHAADPRRHVAEEPLGQVFLDGLDVCNGQAGVQRPHPAGDVEAHPTRRDHAVLFAEGRHPPNGKAITPVGVGHGIGGLHDAGQAGHVGDLLQHLVVHLAQQGFAGIQDAGNPHGGSGLEPPLKLGFLNQAGYIHRGLLQTSTTHCTTHSPSWFCRTSSSQ